MTVTGNRPPPYHDAGLLQCLRTIKLAAEKALIIIAEKTREPEQEAYFAWITDHPCPTCRGAGCHLCDGTGADPAFLPPQITQATPSLLPTEEP
jgi:hypothetical protein